MELIGVGLIGIGMLLAKKEVNAKRKRLDIEKGTDFIYTDLTTKKLVLDKKHETVVDGMILGTSTGAVTLFDIYKNIDNHEETIEIIGDSMQDMIEVGSPIEWIESFNPINAETLATSIETSETILDAGDMDITDTISYVAVAMFGIKTYGNLRNYKDGNQTRYELGINVGMDAAKVGTGGLFAIGGAKVGGVLGTAMMPGVGTIVGSGIGTIVGGIAGGEMFSYVKDRLKWGKIIDCVEHIGKKYTNGFTDNAKSAMKKKYMKVDELSELLEIEKKVMKKYKGELNPYSNKKVSVEAILAYEYAKSLENSIKKVDVAVDGFFPEIKELCKACAKKRNGKKKDEHKFLGEIIMTSGFLESEVNLNQKDRVHIQNYHSQVGKVKSHPYKFSNSTDEILQGLLYKKFSEVPNIETTLKLKNLAHVYYTGAVLFGITGMLLIFM